MIRMSGFGECNMLVRMLVWLFEMYECSDVCCEVVNVSAGKWKVLLLFYRVPVKLEFVHCNRKRT